MTEAKPIINIVAYEEEGGWVAQCLQYDVAAQAETFADLQSEMMRALASHILLNVERGREPFAGLGEAPPKFWAMYGKATPIKDSSGLVGEPPTPEGSKLVAPRFKIADAHC